MPAIYAELRLVECASEIPRTCNEGFKLKVGNQTIAHIFVSESDATFNGQPSVRLFFKEVHDDGKGIVSVEIKPTPQVRVFWKIHEDHGLVGRVFFDRDEAVAYAKELHTARGMLGWHEVYRYDGPGREPIGVFQLKPRDKVLASGRVQGWLDHTGKYDDITFTGKCRGEYCGTTREGEYKPHLKGCPELAPAGPVLIRRTTVYGKTVEDA